MHQLVLAWRLLFAVSTLFPFRACSFQTCLLKLRLALQLMERLYDFAQFFHFFERLDGYLRRVRRHLLVCLSQNLLPISRVGEGLQVRFPLSHCKVRLLL